MDTATKAAPQASAEPASAAGRPLRWAMLAALGVVFGDLGTSPLYTLQTVVQTMDGRFTRAGALGTLSLIVWTLIVTISIKYCLFVMRADNRGEGGILALMSLIGANGPGLKPFTVMGLARRSLDLRRWRDYPGDLGVERARRRERRHRRIQALCHAHGGGDPRRAVHESALRNRAHRACLRPCDAVVVPRHRSARAHLHRPSSRGPGGPGSDSSGALHDALRRAGTPGARRGVFVHHRRRGALRGHGPLRQASGATLMVFHRAARAAFELRGSNRVAPR